MVEPEPPTQEPAQTEPKHTQVVHDLAVDLQQILTRKGRAPFVLSGLPMFEDLCAYHHTLAQCLAIGDDPHLRQWYTVLAQTLPLYQVAFAEVELTLEWVAAVKQVLTEPPATAPALDGNALARQLAHYLGQLADIPDLSPWLAQFRQHLLAVSERYWSGLFHCYDIEALPPTNNDHERCYGQLKRQLRRQLGVSQLRQPLLRRGAWMLCQIEASSPAELTQQLAQVCWDDYARERARYDQRQDQFRQRYRWRHQRDLVLQQRIDAWAEALSVC